MTSHKDYDVFHKERVTDNCKKSVTPAAAPIWVFSEVTFHNPHWVRNTL